MQLKNQRSAIKNVCGFSNILVKKLLISNSPCTLLNKNINFNKSNTESKMENPTRSFRKTNLVLLLQWDWQFKSKIVMSWSFLYRLFYPKGNIFQICFFSQCVVYGIHFRNKTLFHALLLLVFKIGESLYP